MRILDMTQYEAGTSCTQALAWLGADVVKVEPPGRGDPGRHVQPGDGNSPYFLNFNSNKRSIVLNLKDPRGRDLLLRMAPHYDVFVENYGPGAIEKLDLGPDVVRRANPRIIYGRLKGFGLSGPYADFKALDPIAQAASGAIALTGPADGPPVYPASMTGDSGTGVQLALAITAAYVECQRTGAGQVIEISMQEAMTFFMRSRASSTIWNTRPALGRGDPNRSGAGPATVRMYPCPPQGLNDYVYIMCTTERMWDSLCIAIEQPELALDPRFATDPARKENNEALAEVIGAWMLGRTKEEAMRTLGEAGVPCSAVMSMEDLFTDPHLRDRGFIQQLDHPEHGSIELLGFAPRLSNGDVPFVRAPLMGEHTDDVLRSDLALESAEIAELRDAGVVA
jgi:formyl-CoA transferase